ncbi:MAG: nuclear transport factor 2 family protein [Acidobacteriota bacterium]
MKKISIFALALCAFTLPLAAQKKSTLPAQETKWVSAVKANDLAALEKIMSPEIVYTHSTGIVETRAQYLAKLKSGEQKYADIVYSEVKTFDLGGGQAVSATIRMTGATKGVPFDNKLHVLHVWTKAADGSMQLVAHQTTKLQ